MLLLVDGSSYVYRAFHALPDLRTSAGFPTGAVRGVISMLERVVDNYQPSYLAVVMDAPGKTFRHEWYTEYKAHRPPMPEDLSAQIPVLLKLIQGHGWPLLQISGVEADDVIGTLAMQALKAGEPCLISTGDKDLAQLVQPGIELMNTMTNENLDDVRVFEKFGVHPHQIVDYLTLVGDSVDNVPGVPRVGPKTAAKWLAQYGSLDAIIEHVQDFSGTTGEALRTSLDWLPQAKRLVTVVCDVPLSVDWKTCVPGAPDRATVSDLYTQLEFKTLLKAFLAKYPVLHGNKAVFDVHEDGIESDSSLLVEAEKGGDDQSQIETPRTDALPQETLDQNNTIHEGRSLLIAEGLKDKGDQPAIERGAREIIGDEASLRAWIERLQTASCVAFDTETTSLDPMRAQVIGISWAIEGYGAAYLPLAHDEPGLDREWALSLLKPWLESVTCPKVCQHAKYDEHVLENHGIKVQGVIGDTLLQSYILTAHLSHGLDHLAARYLGWTLVDYEELCGKGAKQIPFSSVPVEIAGAYACDDAESTLYLHRILNEKLAQYPRMHTVYETIELPSHRVLRRMERRGILLDADVLYEHSASLSRRLDALEFEAHTLAGRAFNLASPKQIQALFYDEMKLPILKRTPKGQPSTDEAVLEELALNYPLPKLLLEHRTLAKLKSTYTDKLPLLMDDQGRLHTHYNQTVAVTGRLSSSDPNLQNIPIRTAEGRRIRQAFVATPGYRLIAADYSQIELRIMAHLSNDARLVAAFEHGDDIHRATAAEIFGVAPEAVTSEQRRYIKAINFGLMYGMSSFGLAVQLGIDRASAQRYINQYFERYTGVASYLTELKAEAHKLGYVETVLGRRLYLPELTSKGPRRAAAERAATNAPMQGTAADLIKLAMIAVQSWLDKEAIDAYLLLQVHDELVLEAREECVDQVVAALPDIMCNVIQLRVPLAVDVGTGSNWDAAH